MVRGGVRDRQCPHSSWCTKGHRCKGGVGCQCDVSVGLRRGCRVATDTVFLMGIPNGQHIQKTGGLRLCSLRTNVSRRFFGYGPH